MRPTYLGLACLVVLSCTRAPTEVDAGVCECTPTLAASGPPTLKNLRSEPTAASVHVTPLKVCEARGRLPLEAAREYFDHGQFDQALSCAAQAAALMPSDVLAHTERGNALAALERTEEARLAFARALAIDPDSIDALYGAAHLYVVQLPSSRELDELGSLYADRGFELAQTQHDAELSLSFARLAAMAYNDVGQAKEALDRADWVLERKKGDPEALYERAAALFELCRFDEARPLFELLLKDKERAAFAHRHLGLVLERQGRQAEADRHLEAATRLDPKGIPAPVLLSPQAFREELERTVAALPPDMRRDLAGVPVVMEDVPALDDLVASDPPLSPQILGLFRGPPLGEACEAGPDGGVESPCRQVVLYRRNLGRAVRTPEELVEQIRVTLLHEVGHLRGEDDGELAARGLE
jgi:tetratricopeptide (TPR) repeat protein